MLRTRGHEGRGGTGWGSRPLRLLAGFVLLLGVLALPASPVDADGTEQLGPPSVAVASGSGMVSAGVGLVDGPASFTLDVPVEAEVRQVLLYWEGHFFADQPPGTIATDQITINGTPVTGQLIGGPTTFFRKSGKDVRSITYRADITALGLIGPGSNQVQMGQPDFSFRNNGAGVIAIIKEGGKPDVPQTIFDGNDLAFINFAPPLDTTVPVTFTFEPADQDREAELHMFASSVDDGRPRPNVVVGTDSNGRQEQEIDPFGSREGAEWDSEIRTISIPAGVSSLTLQALSADVGNSGNLPASFAWLATGLTIQPISDPEVGGITQDPPVTGGTVVDAPPAQPIPAQPSFTG